MTQITQKKSKTCLPRYLQKPPTFRIQEEASQAIPVTVFETCISHYTTCNLDFLGSVYAHFKKTAQSSTLNIIAISVRITV